MEVNGQLHASAASRQEKNHWYPLDRRLGGPQSRFGRGGEEKNSQPPPGIEHPRTPIVQPVAQRYTDWAITALPFVSKNKKPETQTLHLFLSIEKNSKAG
jgi:hypothetical protein